MPGVLSRDSRPVVVQHDTASNFLAFAYPTLRRHEASSNIVLAHALKIVSTEAALSGHQSPSDADLEHYLSTVDASAHAARPSSGSFWLTLWSPSSPPTLDLVLSCVSWTLGEYPIFLWTPHRRNLNSPEWLLPRIYQLADHLQLCVKPERVFSVFGMTPLVKTFARYWSNTTGFEVEPEPFYAAYFSYCNADTFVAAPPTLPAGHALRKATILDVDQVAQLCKEFADDSVYFPLDIRSARIEARELITKGQMWVYDAAGDITTICAATRNSSRVSAITKVYTTPRWRRRRCAEFLVRDVTAQLLFQWGKDCVVLYVGHENSAQRVYDRVGFVGLCGKQKTDAIEDSVELGFVGAERGHW